VGYAVLGAALLWSRLAQLGHSFWTDEIVMVDEYVRAGPREILAGPDLSHELMAILAWATGALTGESEIAFRLWSALPFVAAVVFVTVWLHRRFGDLAAIVYLFLATVSPLLLDITRQARGYGIAFLAMSVVIVAALETVRRGEKWTIVAMCAAGVLGTWTLPQLGVAFVATGIVLVAVGELRRSVAIALLVSVAAIVAWYAPHLGEVRSASQIEDGVRIGFPWIITAPIDQILIPALVWIDGTALLAGLVWLPLVLLAIAVAGASPLARDHRALALLVAGPVATVVVLWIADAYVIPRYLSYLVVPLFALLATGTASVLGRIPERWGLMRSVVCVVVLAVLAVRFASLAPDVVRLPREANRDAAEVVGRHAPAAPVVTYVRNPRNVEFYLGRPVESPEPEQLPHAVCARKTGVFYVLQPFTLEPVAIPCLERAGVELSRFRQYARGGETSVWYVPSGG
jgi:hypothetical protein